MKRFIIAMMLLLAASALAAEVPSGLRDNALDLLQALHNSAAVNSFPEEYASFAATVARAEELQQRGEADGADQLFSLAVLKGSILLNRKTEPPPAAAVAKPLPREAVFTPYSSPPPPEPAQPPPTAAADDEDSEEAPAEEKISARIIGGRGVYIVPRKESLKMVASRLGVRQRDLAAMNRLKTDAMLVPGQKLKYNNRRIIPKTMRNGIIVNIPDRNLYLFRNGRVAASYPVALGISKKKESTIWRTPVGKFQIIEKKENPTWRIPPSIQKEMEENGEEVLEVMPPGPKNPLGKYAIRTNLSGILIHSTTRPASINSYSSHGCIRVMPEHMERLFKSISVPMQGEIIYQPVKVEVTGDGRVFLEVNRDSYEQVEDIAAEVRKALSRHRVEGRVSWQRVNQVTSEKTGIAEEVTLAAMPD